MAKSYWLINKNRTDVKRFIKNDKSTVGDFEYMFIDTGKIDGVIKKGNPVIITTVSVEIDFGYIFRVSTKPVWKGTRIESIEDGLKEYEELLKEGWKRTSLYKRNFK